jgi:glutamate-5-semialdehyde dehydrogenase
MHDLTYRFAEVRKASRQLLAISEPQIQATLSDLVELTMAHSAEILAANQQDLTAMDPADPRYDRLLLSMERLAGICQEIKQVSSLLSPLHRILEEKHLANGLHLQKISVPLGVIGIIYEARPNVTFDVFSLALKSGNGLVLKGGTDAQHSNAAIMGVIHKALAKNKLPVKAFQLLPAGREAAQALMEAVGLVDVIIPRGSHGLIDFVRAHSKVPVIETGAGIVHTYFDESGDLEKAKAIVFNAKTRRPSVCNSLDCLIVHQSRLAELNEMVEPLLRAGVEIFADGESFAHLPKNPLIQPATPDHFGTEFLSLKMSIKTVANLQEALDHISQYSSQHSEAIISENQEHIDTFLQQVDAAAVYANASTGFTDGNQFGLGAEIGISTQKLHARGPMALNELTSYKWIIRGNGQVRK